LLHFSTVRLGGDGVRMAERFHMKTIIIGSCLLFTTVFGIGCDDSPTPATTQPAQTTGDKIQNAAEKTGDAIHRGVDATGDALKSAADKTGPALEKAADKTGEALNKAADKTGEIVGTALEKTGTALERAQERANQLTTRPATTQASP
jgi:hypothetical protein